MTSTDWNARSHSRGPTALEVNPVNPLSGHDPVAVVRLTVESLAVEVDSFELSKAGIVDSAEEAPIGRRERGHEGVVVERQSGPRQVRPK